MNRNTRIVNFLWVLALISSCSRSVHKNVEEKKDCKQILMIVEKNLFYSCPISKSLADVILYLDKLEGFVRNNEYDSGNGSVRYNARNAKYDNSNLIDEKSIFFINHTIEQGKESKLLTFQAIYYFESEEEKDRHLNKILEVLNNELRLKQEIRYDLLNNSYLQYYLPCKIGINIKQSGKLKDKYFIDVLWGPVD
jgi:hypothetical protein